MNWLDKAISFFSPQKAYQRITWRNSLNNLKSYDATNEQNSNWHSFNESAELTDRYNRDNLRAKARDLERNSDMMNAVIKSFERNVFGGAYTLQARTPYEKLNDEIEKYWKIWTKKANCDLTKSQSFNQMMRMAVRRKKVDGGILFIKVYTNDGLIPFKLQTIEVDELDINQLMPEYKNNRVVGGIEYDLYNRKIGYWIKQYDIDGLEPINARFVKADDVIFYYSKKRPSQIREISDVAATLTRIRDVNEFINAVSLKERILACLAIFIKKQNSNVPGRFLNTQSEKEYPKRIITPGMIQELNIGDDIEAVTPSGQSADAAEFIKLQERLIGAGQGLSYESTSRDMSETTYSSARQALIEDEMTYIEEIELLKEVMSEIYESFVISLYQSGLITIENFWDNKYDFLKHEWIQASKKWIDPYKEAKANEIAIKTCQKTFRQIAAENGRDYKEQLDELIDILSYAKEKGFDLASILFENTSNFNKYEEGEIEDEDNRNKKSKKKKNKY